MKASLGHIVALGAGVYATWLLLSGHYTPFLLIVGLICTALVVYIALRMDVVDAEGVPTMNLTAKFFTYMPWFVLEIVKSNLATARVILSPTLPINPLIFQVRGLQRTDLGRVIFANSITLTPGTTTIAVRGENLLVHALVADSATGMDEGEMNRRVASLERGLVDS